MHEDDTDHRYQERKDGEDGAPDGFAGVAALSFALAQGYQRQRNTDDPDHDGDISGGVNAGDEAEISQYKCENT